MTAKTGTKRRKPRLVDIAREAEVSQMVVSLVLNPRPSSVRVSKETQRRVLDIAKQMDYQPNLVAQQLAGKRSKLIGVILDTHNYIGNETILVSMESYASTRGYRFLAGHTHDDFDQISEYATDFMGRGVEGVVVVAHSYPKFGSKVAKLFLRFQNNVFLQKPNIDQPVNYVGNDYQRVSEIALEHLLQLGRKRVVLAVRDRVYKCNQDLVEGYAKVAGSDNREFCPQCVVESGLDFRGREREWAENLVKKILPLKPDGLLVGSDIEAMWVLSALKEKGISVPCDMSVVSLYHWSAGQAFSPSLTSIDMRQGDIALEAIKMLIDDIEGKKGEERTARKVVLEPKLVIGDSCGARQIV